MRRGTNALLSGEMVCNLRNTQSWSFAPNMFSTWYKCSGSMPYTTGRAFLDRCIRCISRSRNASFTSCLEFQITKAVVAFPESLTKLYFGIIFGRACLRLTFCPVLPEAFLLWPDTARSRCCRSLSSRAWVRESFQQLYATLGESLTTVSLTRAVERGLAFTSSGRGFVKWWI